MKAISKLLIYLKPYKLFAILAPLLMLVEVSMDLLQPTIMQHIIDNGIANNDQAYVVKYGILMFIIAIIGFIGGIGSSIYATKAAVNFATDIRRDLYQHISKFSNDNMDRFTIGKLITIMTNDLSSIQHALMMTLKVFVRGPIQFIGSVIIVWFTARQLFPILIVAIPIFIIAIYYFSTRSSIYFGKVQQAMDQMNKKVQETLAGMRLIKAYHQEEKIVEEFDEINEHYTKRNLKAEQLILLLQPFLVLVANMSIVIGMWVGAIRINENTMQIGVILAFINYLNIVMNGLMLSSNVLIQITKAFPSCGRVVDVLEEVPTTNNTKTKIPSMEANVEFRNVSFSYSKNGEYVLKDINFVAKQGQTIGIIGKTGAGKSTLAKLLTRLYEPTEGEILLDSIPIQKIDLTSLRQLIGYVPQKALLFSGTIKSNLQFGKLDANDLELNEAINNAAAKEFITKLPNELDYELTQQATNLSGGQKQRLSMARAFIKKSPIMIFDDSTSAVDSISEATIQQAIRENTASSTVFIISSKLSSVIACDQILVLDDGQLVAKGTHEELLEKSTIYQEIYAAQSSKEVLHFEA